MAKAKGAAKAKRTAPYTSGGRREKETVPPPPPSPPPTQNQDNDMPLWFKKWLEGVDIPKKGECSASRNEDIPVLEVEMEGNRDQPGSGLGECTALPPVLRVENVLGPVQNVVGNPGPSLSGSLQGQNSVVGQGQKGSEGAGTSSTSVIRPEVNSRMVSLPLSAGVPLKVMEKIWEGEFVEMSQLISLKDDDWAEKSYKLKTTKDGSVKLSDADKPRWLTYDNWRRAFDKFTAIMSLKYPLITPKLVKYANIVTEIHARGGNFQYYDRQFRMLKQSVDVAWDIMHTELWLLAIMSKRGTAPLSKMGNQSGNWGTKFSSQNHGGSEQARGIPKGYCYAFHSRSQCSQGSQCKFNHLCFRCGGQHSILQHPSSAASGTGTGAFPGGKGSRFNQDNQGGSRNQMPKPNSDYFKQPSKYQWYA